MCIACALAARGGAATHGGSPFPGSDGPLPWGDGRQAGGTLRWTGVAGLRVDLDGTSVAVDPFVSRPGLLAVLLRRPRPAFEPARARFSGLEAVFVGHTHYDHAMDLPAVIEASPDAVVYGSRTTVELLRRLGVPPRSLDVVADARVIEVGSLRVTAIAADHGKVPWIGRVDPLDLGPTGVPKTPFRYPRGDVFAYRIEGGGRSLHVQGSAGIDDVALHRQAPADALFACLAARHGTPRYLDRLVETLRPRLLLPFHHDDFFRPLEEPPREIPTLDWATFLEDARRLEANYGTRLHCPARDVDLAF